MLTKGAVPKDETELIEKWGMSKAEAETASREAPHAEHLELEVLREFG
jgi:hypothetical protein